MLKGWFVILIARAIEKVFMKEKSVAGSTVNLLKKKKLKFLQKKGMNIDDDIIREKIKDSGYIVSSIERILMDKRKKIIINTNSCSFCRGSQYLSMLCYTCTSSSNWCNSGALSKHFFQISLS